MKLAQPAQPGSWLAGMGWLLPLIVLAVLGASLIYGVGLAAGVSPLMLVAAPVALALGVSVLFKPELAALALLGVTWGLLSDVAVRNGAPSITKPLAAALAAALVLRRFVGKRTPFVYDSAIWWLGAWVLIVALGMWHSRHPELAQEVTTELVKDMVICFVLVNFITNSRFFQGSIWVLLAVGALLGTLTIYQELTHSYDNDFGTLAQMKIAYIAEGLEDRPRASGPASDPNPFGQQLAVLVPMGLWAMFNGRSLFQRVAGGYAAVACMGGVALSFSRSTFLALGLMLLLYAVHIRLNWRFVFALVPIMVGLFWVAPPELTARLSTLQDLLPGNSERFQSDGAYVGRSSEMLMSVYMFADHPVLGVGAGNSPYYYPEYIRERGMPVPDQTRHTHSMPLEIAAEQGLPGILVFLGLIGLTFTRLRQAAYWFRAAGDRPMAELAVALQIAFAGYLVTALFLHAIFPQFLWVQVALSVALAHIARRAAGVPQPESLLMAARPTPARA